MIKTLAIAALTAFATSAISADALAQTDKVQLGVSIPAATHGWTGGLNYHARQAIERLT